MKSGPLVSVVIPAFNSGKFIREAIDSVLAQTYKNYEIIVVDDGSTDNTKEILQPYIKKGQIKYIYQTNQRQAAARNNGIRRSKGELIAFLDSDDLWLPKKLESQLPFFQESSIGLVYSGLSIFDEDNNTLEETDFTRYRKGRIFDDLLASNFIPTSTVMIRRSCIDKAGFFRDYKLGQDWDLWLRISAGFKIDYVDQILTRYRSHHDNVSKKDPKVKLNIDIKILKRIFTDFRVSRKIRKKVLSEIKSVYFFNLGYSYRKHNKVYALYCYLMSRFHKADPIQIKAIRKLFTRGYYDA